MKFQGVYPALLTPFFENGNIDFESLEKLIDFLIGKGVHGLFPLGTTGEGLLLSTDARKKVAQHVIKSVNERIPVIVHVGTISTKETIELAQHAEKSGADGISVVCPYFFPLDDQAIYQHFKRIAESVSDDFPLFVYHFPENSRNNIELNVLLKLIESCPNIRALKFTSDDFTQIQQYINATPEDFSVMLGPDQYYLAGLHMGSHGSVSGNANVFPEPYVKLFDYYQKGLVEEAKKEQKKISYITETFKYGSNVSMLKKGLEFRGLNGGSVRAPLRDIDEKEKEEMFKLLESLNVNIKEE